MSVIKSENWDGATAPSIPAGWNVGTPTGAVAIVTTTSGGIPISSPNLIVAGVGTSSGFDTITWGTLDGNAGNVQVQGTFQFNSSGGTGNVAASVFARCNSSTANYLSSNFYELRLAGADGAVEINKYLGGTKSTLFSVSTSSLASGIWYQATLQLSGSPTTSIRAIVQRLTDNYYLQSGGTFGSGVSIITGVDSSSSIAGQGYAGWAASTGAAQPVFGDDWSLSTFSLPVGSMASTAAYDTFSGTSNDYYGALVQTESHDAFAASGMATAGSSMAMSERHDIASIYARVSPFMQAAEHRDTFAGSSTAAAATAMTTTETGDTFRGGLESHRLSRLCEHGSWRPDQLQFVDQHDKWFDLHGLSPFVSGDLVVRRAGLLCHQRTRRAESRLLRHDHSRRERPRRHQSASDADGAPGVSARGRQDPGRVDLPADLRPEDADRISRLHRDRRNAGLFDARDLNDAVVGLDAGHLRPVRRDRRELVRRQHRRQHGRRRLHDRRPGL